MEPIGHRSKAIWRHDHKRGWIQVKRGDRIRTYKNVTRASVTRVCRLSLKAGCERYPDTYDVLTGAAWVEVD